VKIGSEIDDCTLENVAYSRFMYFGFVFTYDNDCSQDLWTRTGKEKAETKSMENIWKIETLSNDMKQHTCTLETTVFSAIWM